MLLISNTYWLGLPFAYKGTLSDQVLQLPVQLKAADMRDSQGIYYAPAQHPTPKVAILVTHPRVDFSRHYCIPRLVEAGFSVLGLNGRNFNNDMTAIHEGLILDVAAGVKFLKEERGAEQVILFGNSGGGSLSAFYQQQACLPQGQRIATTPAGDPTKLNASDMIPVDGYIAVSAHKGQGLILEECIDPAVIDENDPLQNNAELDMYDTANGFVMPPEPSHYSDEFFKKYRTAQKDRIKKLDNIAYELINDAKTNDAHYKELKGQNTMERHHIGRRAAMEKIMTIYRTMANPNYTDPSLDANNRRYGSLLSERPDLMNMQAMGFARILTPQAWLSTWSANTSNANMLKTLPDLKVPVLMINAARDKEIYPQSAAQTMWAAVKAEDKTFLSFDAEHYFEPEFGAQSAPDVELLMDSIIPWIKERFGE